MEKPWSASDDPSLFLGLDSLPCICNFQKTSSLLFANLKCTIWLCRLQKWSPNVVVHMNNRCVCWYWHGLVQSGTKLCRYMAYLLAVMIKGMSSPPQRPPAAVAHNGRSSSGCGLSVHGHPGRDRPPAVPWSPATDLPLWPPLLEEAVHPLQGEPASNLPHTIIHKPGGTVSDCLFDVVHCA